MSHAVVRGAPTTAQLYLDQVLDEVVSARGRSPAQALRHSVTLSEILYHCLRKSPGEIFMINGATGEMFTNEQILRRAVSVARSIVAKGVKGRTVMMVMRNHEWCAALYLAVLLAGVVPFIVDPNTTRFEMSHFLKLVEPCYVFCDQEHVALIAQAANETRAPAPEVVPCTDRDLAQFTVGFSDDTSAIRFENASSSPRRCVMLLPTSGSTGLPKAAIQSDRGLVAQLPVTWLHHLQFPKPTDLAMLLTTAQWMTFTMTLTSSCVYNIPILMSPKSPTVEHVTEMMEKYRPTWTFFGPSFAKSLLESVSAEQLSSLQTVTLLGAPSTPELRAAFLNKLSGAARLCDGYGTTETQGYIAIPDPHAPVHSNGPVINILQYRLVDDHGVELGPGNHGELHVKGISVIEGYYKDKASYADTFTDGWYKTGDLFYCDENERLYFVKRKKFSFKYMGCHVSPEEVESVISSVRGVHETVVCSTEQGPAAAVVLHDNARVTREEIHHVVDSSLSAHKRLRGGIAFVPALPHTHSGKLKRYECQELIHQLVGKGMCL